jgi:hypothetical protein
MAIPGQGYRTFGAELLALGVICGAALYVLDRRAKASRSDQAIAQVLEAVTPTWSRRCCCSPPGSSWFWGLGAGLYVLVAPVLTGPGRRRRQRLAVPDQDH